MCAPTPFSPQQQTNKNTYIRLNKKQFSELCKKQSINHIFVFIMHMDKKERKQKKYILIINDEMHVGETSRSFAEMMKSKERYVTLSLTQECRELQKEDKNANISSE